MMVVMSEHETLLDEIERLAASVRRGSGNARRHADRLIESVSDTPETERIAAEEILEAIRRIAVRVGQIR